MTIDGDTEYFVESFRYDGGGFKSKQLNNIFPIKIISIQIKGASNMIIVDKDLMPIVNTISGTQIVYPNIVVKPKAILKISGMSCTFLRLVGERAKSVHG